MPLPGDVSGQPAGAPKRERPFCFLCAALMRLLCSTCASANQLFDNLGAKAQFGPERLNTDYVLSCFVLAAIRSLAFKVVPAAARQR